MRSLNLNNKKLKRRLSHQLYESNPYFTLKKKRTKRTRNVLQPSSARKKGTGNHQGFNDKDWKYVELVKFQDRLIYQKNYGVNSGPGHRIKYNLTVKLLLANLEIILRDHVLNVTKDVLTQLLQEINAAQIKHSDPNRLTPWITQYFRGEEFNANLISIGLYTDLIEKAQAVRKYNGLDEQVVELIASVVAYDRQLAETIEARNDFLAKLQLQDIQRLVKKMTCFPVNGPLEQLVDKAVSSRNNTSHSKFLSNDDFKSYCEILESDVRRYAFRPHSMLIRTEFENRLVEALQQFIDNNAHMKKEADYADEITGTYKALGANIILPNDSDVFDRITLKSHPEFTDVTQKSLARLEEMRSTVNPNNCVKYLEEILQMPDYRFYFRAGYIKGHEQTRSPNNAQ